MIKYYIRRLKAAFNNSSIKNKLMVIILSISIVCVFITVLSFSSYGIYNIRQEMKSDLSVTASIITNSINSSLYFQNNTIALDALKALSGNNTVRSACIYDNIGNVFATFSAGKVTSILCPKMSKEGAFFSNKRLELFREIKDQFDGRILGTLYISSDLSKIYSYIYKQLIIVLSIIILAMIVAYIMAIKLQSVISTPITYLINKNKEAKLLLNQNANFYKSSDEIVKLDSLFNGMNDHICSLKEDILVRDKKIKYLLGSVNTAFKYLSDEANSPIQSVVSFSDIIQSKLLGNISDRYILYFYDLYTSIYLYYGIINDTHNFFRRNFSDCKNKNLVEMDVTNMLKDIFDSINSNRPNYLEKFEFCYEVKKNNDIPALKLGKFILKEVMCHILSVYAEYLKFLGVYKMDIRVNLEMDDFDIDEEKFKVIVECEQLKGDVVKNKIESHREHEKNMLLLRSKLKFIKFVASNSGGYMDYTQDISTLFRVELIFPLKNILIKSDLDLLDVPLFADAK
jgi:hypothetical protein